jgi:FkbM family methyltransferase
MREVEHLGVRMTFATPNRHTEWRVDTLFTKEPDTLAWLDGLGRDDVLLDVGANVGMYSIYAASLRGAVVHAFEPESQNYAILNQNILLNRLDRQVTAYCVALSDRAGFDRLYLSEFVAGGSCHSWGEPLDFNNRPRTAAFAQGCFATTIDLAVAGATIPIPTHVKIDVDGLEHAVIAGARETLRDRRVRSVLVEVNSNLDEHWEIVDAMLAVGFDYSPDEAARAQRAEGPFKGVGNYVFRR